MWCLKLIEQIKQCIANSRLLAKLFGLILTLLLIFLLMSKIEPEKIVEVIRGLNPYMILLGFFIYLGGIFCRASRFKIVLNNRDLRYYLDNVTFNKIYIAHTSIAKRMCTEES